MFRIQAEEMEVVGDTSSLPLREKLFLQLYRLYYISFYQIRIQVNAASPGNNSNDQANQSTSTNNNNNSLFSRPIDSSIDSALARDQFLEYKRQSISLLLEARQIGYALDLAETFEDYEALIYICEVLNRLRDFGDIVNLRIFRFVFLFSHLIRKLISFMIMRKIN